MRPAKFFILSLGKGSKFNGYGKLKEKYDL